MRGLRAKFASRLGLARTFLSADVNHFGIVENSLPAWFTRNLSGIPNPGWPSVLQTLTYKPKSLIPDSKFQGQSNCQIQMPTTPVFRSEKRAVRYVNISETSSPGMSKIAISKKAISSLHEASESVRSRPRFTIPSGIRLA